MSVFLQKLSVKFSKSFTTRRLCSFGEAAPLQHSWLKWTILNFYISKSLTITMFSITFLCFPKGLPQPLKVSLHIRAFCVIWLFILFMIKLLWAVMCISTHLPNRLECQQRGLNWITPFILYNLIGSHHPGDLLAKVLSWFWLERDWGRPSTCVTEIRE